MFLYLLLVRPRFGKVHVGLKSFIVIFDEAVHQDIKPKLLFF